MTAYQVTPHARTRARILAQLAQDGPSTAAHLFHALALEDVTGTEMDLGILERAGQVRRVAPAGGAFIRKVWRGVVLYELTDPGRLEATGGAQMSMDPRPPIATQPALF